MNNKIEIMKLTTNLTYCSATNLYWTNPLDGFFSFNDAEKYSKVYGVRIPTNNECIKAHRGGLKFDKGWYWTSTQTEAFNYAFCTYGEHGYIYTAKRTDSSKVRFVVEDN